MSKKQIRFHAPKIVKSIAKKVLPRALRRRFGLSNGPHAPLTLRAVRAELAPLGISIRASGGEYIVGRRGSAATSYRSDCLADALASAKRLAAEEESSEEGAEDELP